jgi:hypothetical protein
MDEAIYAILSGIEETHQIALDGTPNRAIVYRLAVGNGAAYEGCRPLVEVYYYIVLIYMKTYDGTLVDSVKQALRAGGWAVGGDEQTKEQVNGSDYYMYALQATKWRET